MTFRPSRRGLLRSLGIGIPAVALPVLRSSPLRAAPPPVRLAVLFKANGTIGDAWKPTGSAANWSIPAGGILEPLAKFKPKLNVLSGVNYDSAEQFVNAAAHQKGPVSCLTGGGANTGPFHGGNGSSSGYGNNISIDQYIANKWGPVTRLKTLELGVAIQGANNRNRISYLGSDQPVPPEPDPVKAYARVFGSFVAPSASGGGRPSEEVLRLIAERKSVLDSVSADLTRLADRLPGDERGRLDLHLSSVRDLERQLSQVGGGGAGCSPKAPATGDGSYPTLSRLQLDIMFMALACDQTRLVTFIWNGETSQQSFPWIGVNDLHHDMSHKPDGDAATRAKLIKVNRYYAGEVNYFLERMDSVVEGNGKTLLDNSLVMFTDGLSKGNNHSRKNIPWVLAGSARGAVPTGRYLDFGSTPHNHLLVSVLHAMGLTGETFFGHPSVKMWSGPLPGFAPT